MSLNEINANKLNFGIDSSFKKFDNPPNFTH